MVMEQEEQEKEQSTRNRFRNRLIIMLFCLFLSLSGLFTIIGNAKKLSSMVKAVLKENAASTHEFDGRIGKLTKGIEENISSGFIAKEKYIDLVGLADRMLGKQYINDVDPKKNIVKDNHGLLHFLTRRMKTKEVTDQLAHLNEWLKIKHIPLLYVQTPLKVKPRFTQLPPSIEDFSNSNSNTFLAGLSTGGVDYVDLRSEASRAQMNPALMFYRTDHHWTNQTAFWAVRKVVEKLDEDYGLSLDPDRFYTDPANFTYRTYEHVFLGSQGRRVGKYYGGVDDYTLIAPDFATKYKIGINKNGRSLSIREGSFADTILAKELLDMSSSVYKNRYAAYFGADYREVQITNQNAQNQLKMVIVKDSFGLPFTAFLSTMVNEIRMIDLRYFSHEQLLAYINDFHPDAVLFVYKGIGIRYNLITEILRMSRSFVQE
ncbi:DHHW family protein [Paenibacillus sp. SC116]|uniref:DHHW family protein n=1 Tax=Paenibacillus sp. SC116 TaxID=2968986 RepID=UPI00215B5FA6|nr:DHHW family protein [Paenibacillus sp. SC116]MCR8842355.1 DHHW family protein [Paenibacillus sp. SC116]